jgi:putative tryptophan/tyrosine transport system substrate-binding protein
MIPRAIARVTVLALSILATPVVTAAQQPQGSPRIGVLSSSSPEREQGYLAAFQQSLGDLGYSEGKNLFIERRYAAGKFDALPELAADLVRLKVDILVVTGTPAAHAAKNATPLIPIVTVTAADPVATGLVTRLARPGGNVTGLTDLAPGLVAKRLQLLKEVIPSATRIGVLLNPDNSSSVPQLRLTQEAASALGLSILSVEARRLDDIDRAFATVRAKHAIALLLIADGLLGSNRKRIIQLTAKNRLPAIYWRREFVEDGGLMSYGASVVDLYRRAAAYVDKILKGARPSDLPVEQPTKFELTINLATAKALGLTMPQSIVMRADEVIR